MSIVVAQGVSLDDEGGRVWLLAPKDLERSELNLELTRSSIIGTFMRYELGQVVTSIEIHNLGNRFALRITVGKWEGVRNFLFDNLPPLIQLGKLLEVILKQNHQEFYFFSVTLSSIFPASVTITEEYDLHIERPVALPPDVLALRTPEWIAHRLEDGSLEIIKEA